MNKFISDFSEKNYYCNTFILSSKFFMRFQFRLKSCELVFEIFRRETTEWVSRVRLDVHSHFASFHIRLKLITTECKMLLKYSVLIRCMILLCFLLAFLISSSDQSDWSVLLYISIVSVTLNDYQETVFLSFLIQETVFFIKFSVNCNK